MTVHALNSLDIAIQCFRKTRCHAVDYRTIIITTKTLQTWLGLVTNDLRLHLDMTLMLYAPQAYTPQPEKPLICTVNIVYHVMKIQMCICACVCVLDNKFCSRNKRNHLSIVGTDAPSLKFNNQLSHLHPFPPSSFTLPPFTVNTPLFHPFPPPLSFFLDLLLLPSLFPLFKCPLEWLLRGRSIKRVLRALTH